MISPINNSYNVIKQPCASKTLTLSYKGQLQKEAPFFKANQNVSFSGGKELLAIAKAWLIINLGDIDQKQELINNLSELTLPEKTKGKIVEKLATDTDDTIRESIARDMPKLLKFVLNDNRAEIVEKLATDENWLVRCEMAHKLPELLKFVPKDNRVEIVEKLATDTDEIIIEIVAKNLPLLAKTLKEDIFKITKVLAKEDANILILKWVDKLITIYPNLKSKWDKQDNFL